MLGINVDEPRYFYMIPSTWMIGNRNHAVLSNLNWGQKVAQIIPGPLFL